MDFVFLFITVISIDIPYVILFDLTTYNVSMFVWVLSSSVISHAITSMRLSVSDCVHCAC